MSKLLDILEHMEQFADGRYELAGEYLGYNKPIHIHCKKHDCTFEFSKAESLLEKPPGSYFEGCQQCKAERRFRPRIKVSCAYCGEEMLRPDNWNERNKTDLAFCCREHKVLAQRVGGILVPSHYGVRSKVDSHNQPVSSSLDSYRSIAFNNYPHKCAVCGFDKFIDILEVHHIDGDRSNSSLENLVILCPNCHKLVTLKLYQAYRNGETTTLIKVLDPADARRKEYSAKKSRMKGGFYTDRLVYCIEDSKYFMTYMKAAEYYNVSDTTIRAAALRESNYCTSLNKHFKLVDIKQV